LILPLSLAPTSSPLRIMTAPQRIPWSASLGPLRPRRGCSRRRHGDRHGE
jgi:hypothetical protein